MKEPSESEINSLIQLIDEHTKRLVQVYDRLEAWTNRYGIPTADELDRIPRHDMLELADARAVVLTAVQAVVPTASTFLQKLKTIPSSLMNALSNFLTVFWKIVSRYFNLFKIESIQITISINPSIVVVLKP
jgi:hypothetical protein